MVHRYTRASKVAQGVFACNKLADDVSYPSGYICNTDPDYRPGEHWVAIFIDHEGVGQYFDSFGLPPMKQTFVDFLETHCSSWTYNERTLQSVTSSVCGLYCIYFLVMRCNSFSMSTLLDVFTDDFIYNDSLVSYILK